MTTLIPSTLINSDEALAIVDRVIQQSNAEEVFVSLRANTSALTRFCENQISQNVNRDRLTLTITSYYGKRSASSSTTS